MAKQKADVYVVRQAFSPDGRRVLRRGARLLAGDPRVRGNEARLVLADEGLHDVEQATAAPGEKRNAPTKAELLKQADKVGADVPKSATKAEIVEAIEETKE